MADYCGTYCTNTLKGLGDVNIINRLSEIQVVIEKIFFLSAPLNSKVFPILGALQGKLFSKVTVLALIIFNSVPLEETV